jgi:hypothetical protein
LRRHLRVQHGLEVAEYRARWKLSPDHPVTAPSYSERRSAMAKELGLGSHRLTEQGRAGSACCFADFSAGAESPNHRPKFGARPLSGRGVKVRFRRTRDRPAVRRHGN